MNTKFTIFIVVGIIAGLLIGVGAGYFIGYDTGYNNASTELKVEEVDFKFGFRIVDWNALLYPAYENGYFDDNKVKVTEYPYMVGPLGSVEVIKAVDSKVVEVSWADLSTLAVMRSQDPNLKVKAIGAIYTLPAVCVFVLPDVSGVTSMMDFEGKKVSTHAGSFDDFIHPTFFEAAGVDLSKVEVIPMGYPQSLPSLLADQVQGRLGSITGLPAAQKAAAEAGLGECIAFQAKDYGLAAYYPYCFVAHEDTIQEKPEAIRRFLTAMYEGIQWGLDNPEEATDMMMKYVPELPRESIPPTIELIEPLVTNEGSFQGIQIGKFDPDRIQLTIDIARENFPWGEYSVSATDIYTNELVE
jgi:ABC-type nitrate/sulfonate/bicarbonate transport system substrate-binding protein